jgi:hypothetical protein
MSSDDLMILNDGDVELKGSEVKTLKCLTH